MGRVDDVISCGRATGWVRWRSKSALVEPSGRGREAAVVGRPRTISKGRHRRLRDPLQTGLSGDEALMAETGRQPWVRRKSARRLPAPMRSASAMPCPRTRSGKIMRTHPQGLSRWQEVSAPPAAWKTAPCSLALGRVWHDEKRTGLGSGTAARQQPLTRTQRPAGAREGVNQYLGGNC